MRRGSRGLCAWWWVTLLIYTIILSKLQQHLYPFLYSSPHHSQTANISSQSVFPITILNMSSNSIPLQSMSRWSLDSDNYDAHVNIQNQLHSQHPQLLPLTWLCTMQSQLALNKSYATGDKVLFKGSPEPHIFLGEKQIHWHDDGNQDEYLAEFMAPREPSYTSQSIQRDYIILPSHFLSWDWFKAKLWKYCCLWLTIIMRWSILEPQMICFGAMKTSGWCSLVDLSIVLLYDSMFFSHDSFYFYFS